MDIPLLLAEKIAASASIGLLIGLEREWAHKEAGARSFAIVTLLGTLAWLIAPAVAYVEIGVVITIIILVNGYAISKGQPLEVTTSLALAVTNVLGILVGMGAFFLAFTSAIVVAALLSWKTELVGFSSKLTVGEIRGTLLLAFVSAVIYPLLPDAYVDPWRLVNPHSIWLTVVIVSGLSFINYIFLRQFGARGIRYSAILGGLINSAAMSALLGNELKNDPDTAPLAPSNFLLSDLAMIVRDSILVALFSLPINLAGSRDVLIVLGTMVLVAALVAVLSILRAERKQQEAPQKPPLKSPLSLRSVLTFALLFLTLTVVSGAGQKFFGAIGFLAVVIIGALASAASSAVLVGGHIQQLGPGLAAVAMYCATLVGLTENIVIFYTVTRNQTISLRLALYTFPIVLAGALMLALVLLLGF